MGGRDFRVLLGLIFVRKLTIKGIIMRDFDLDYERDLAEAFDETVWSDHQDDELTATDRQTKRELEWERWADMVR